MTGQPAESTDAQLAAIRLAARYGHVKEAREAVRLVLEAVEPFASRDAQEFLGRVEGYLALADEDVRSALAGADAPTQKLHAVLDNDLNLSHRLAKAAERGTLRSDSSRVVAVEEDDGDPSVRQGHRGGAGDRVR